MKIQIALPLTLVLLFAATNHAQSSRDGRRSGTRASTNTGTDFSHFIGTWEYSDESSRKSYIQITEEQPGRFKFMQGFEYEGNISWAATMVNGADAIYLKPLRGKLVGRFVSPNFRATHGYDITYRITLSLQSNGQLLYSLSGDLAPETYYAIRIGGRPQASSLDAAMGESSSTSNRVGGQNSLIGFIQIKHIAGDLGCKYFFKSDPTRVVYSDDFNGNIWMNIDGQDVKVEFVSSVSSPKKFKMGQRTISSYVAPGVMVRIDTVVTKAEYEGSEYAGSVTVTKGNRRQRLNVVGACSGG